MERKVTYPNPILTLLPKLERIQPPPRSKQVFSVKMRVGRMATHEFNFYRHACYKLTTSIHSGTDVHDCKYNIWNYLFRKHHNDLASVKF